MNKTIITAIVVAIIFGGGGFYGGMQYASGQKSPLTTQRPGHFGGRGGGNFVPGQGGANSNASFVSGQITAKNGNSLTIQSRDGSSKIVILSGSTAVGKSVSGSLSDLATGQNVMITGTTNSDGSVTAENVQIRPAAPAGGHGRPATNTAAPSNAGN